MEETPLFKLTDPFNTAPCQPPYKQAVSRGLPWDNIPVTRDYTLGQLLDQTIARCGPQDALVYADRDFRLTWYEFGIEVDRLACGLMALGVQRGEKIGLWATNVPHWIPLMFAAAKIGAVLLPLNTSYKSAEIDFALKQSDAGNLFLINGFRDTDYVQTIYDLIPELKEHPRGALKSARYPFLKRVFFLGPEKHRGMFSINELLALSVQRVSGVEAPKSADGKATEASTTTNRTREAVTITNRTQGAIQVVETPTHVFRFYRDARVEVAIKKGEDFIGKPIGLRLGAGYADATKQWRARPIKEYVKEPEWDAKSQSILHQLMLADGVRADVYYQVKNGVLYTGLSVKEPAGISFPGSYCVGIAQFDVLTYDSATNLYKGWPAPEGVANDKLAATLKGMQVSIKCKKANLAVYPYSKNIQQFVAGEIDEVAVAGVYGKQVFSLLPPASNGFLTPYIYPGNAPYQGYSVSFHKRDLRHPATSPSELMRLTVK